MLRKRAWAAFFCAVAIACGGSTSGGAGDGGAFGGASGGSGAGAAGGAGGAGGSGGGLSCADGGACPTGMVCSNVGICMPAGTGGVSGVGGFGGNGGVGGSAAVSGNAGVAGTGGSVQCAPVGSTPGSCVPDDFNDPCQTCVQSKCCAEYEACLGTAPDNPCAWGGPGGYGEVFCFQQCLYDAGVADPTTQAVCAGNCTTPGCGTIAESTNELIICLNDNCFSECVQP